MLLPEPRGLRAKTDQLDATTIARALLSGEARFGYVPSEQVATYRELMRLQHQLSDDVVRYKNEIHALLVVLFPEFTQVFVDPTRSTALAVLKRYPSAQAIAQTDVETLSKFLHERAPRHYGRPTAQELVRLAKASISSGVAVAARASSLRILCDQLEHTQKNLEQLQREIDQWSPTSGSICRSNRAGNGKGRPSCPSTEAGECAASCTWPRYEAFTWKHPPLGLTTIAWWLVV